LDSELSGYENIYRLGLLLGMPKIALEKLMPSIVEFTELGNFLEAPVRTYSSGMLMRLMFAVSTSNQPEILLVDEMFGTGGQKLSRKGQGKNGRSDICGQDICVCFAL
jgi:ABC-2 type transport system ATP-binding protein